MADPNGGTLNSEEISDLLHTFLQSSTFPSPRISEPIGLIDSSSDLNFCFPTQNCAPVETDSPGFAFSAPIASPVDRISDLDSDRERDFAGPEARQNPESSMSSLKRTRMAEFHNLSEKKRRQKINENLKALQKSIPNSNKTDKASILDDAINYLRHLQLQVQMLAVRNGSFFRPYYMTEPTPLRTGYSEKDEVSCFSRVVGSVYGNQEYSMAVYDPDQYAFFDGKTLMPSAHSMSLDPSISAHCKP